MRRTGQKCILPMFVAGFCVSALARSIYMPTLPVSQHADTEVSTNIVIHPSRTDVRDVKLHLQLDGTANNDLEVGFGCDVNTNGVLDAEEIATVYGWRGGCYFIENVRAWERFETEATNNVQSGVVDIHMELGPNFVPKDFTATCGGETVFAGFSSTPPPAWLFRNSWKLMRVVRRGAAAPSEWVRCEVGYNHFVIKLR